MLRKFRRGISKYINVYIRSDFAEIGYSIPSNILKKLSLLDCPLNFSILSFGMVIDA